MRLESLIQELPRPSVILIAGARGSGKDVTAHQLARAIHSEFHKQVMIDLDPEKYSLPNYFHEFKGEFKNDTIMLMSDAHLELYAREWHTDYNSTIDKLISISRHKDIDFILTTQETSRLDKNVVMAVDALILKETGFLAREFERPELRKIIEEANRTFEGTTRRERLKMAYAATSIGSHVIRDIQLPYYWSEELSKRYGSLDWNQENPEEKGAVLKIRQS